MHPELTQEQARYVVGCVCDFVAKASPTDAFDHSAAGVAGAHMRAAAE